MYIKIFESDSYISNVSFGSGYSTYTYVVLIQESVFIVVRCLNKTVVAGALFGWQFTELTNTGGK